jgi:hypothetical protein
MFYLANHLAHVRKGSLVLVLLLLMAVVSSAYAGPKPPVEKDSPLQTETVGGWCKLTAYTPYREGSPIKGKSDFRCSGNTSISAYSTNIQSEYGTGPYTSYRNFTATGGTTYYTIASTECRPGTSTYYVFTELMYTDPGTGKAVHLWTTGPRFTATC